jgi:hypothetical protein
MALTHSLPLQFNAIAPEFNLKGTILGKDAEYYGPAQYRSEAKALLVIFICNHCPYVVAIQERLVLLAQELMPQGLRIIGINSNDATRYPDDSFQNMQARSKEVGYPFPYVIDETQTVARAYDAVCTPDPYLYENVDGQFHLRYHGRIDDNWKDPTAIQSHDLKNAIKVILNGEGLTLESSPQHSSMGCSIKWKI